MSIYNKNIDTFIQKFDVSAHNKHTHGEVNTDFILINKILDLLPQELYADKTKKWLDPCCGKGYFTIILYKRLFKSLSKQIQNPLKRHKHIIENMIYMIEINQQHINEIYMLFGENCNILNGDFLNSTNQKYDIIIGNPPFNVNGIVKVPTQRELSKKSDGKMIWASFVLHAIGFLKDNGYLAFITPSIWMKKDHFMYSKMLQYTIEKLHTMTNTQTNQAFHGQAQTPTCYFSLKKTPNVKSQVTLYDSQVKKYINFPLAHSIPLFGESLFKKLAYFTQNQQHLIVKKTNMPLKGVQFSLVKSKNFPYRNIKTCRLNKTEPYLDINYSNKECRYANVPKLILAHKMYGFPFHDKKGEYGISNRDNYVIMGKTEQQLKRIKDFLSTKTALYLFEGTRYRMKYLEKYVFELIPDISNLNDFPENITDETIADYFNFSEEERLNIQKFQKKRYEFF
jgi:tRNA1(Val) A37 N6-methylase TrmN6